MPDVCLDPRVGHMANLLLKISLPILMGFFSQSFAIENLQLGCADLLKDQDFQIDDLHHIQLQPYQILVRGKLEPYWETGMEDQIGWSIIDEDFDLKMFPSPYSAIYFLREGDQVFFLDDSDQVVLSGLYSETREPQIVIIQGRELQIHPNMPHLFHDAEKTLLAAGSDELIEFFQQRRRAVVIQTLEPPQFEALRTHLRPQIEAFERHIQNPDRYVRLGKRIVYELAYFERAILGNLRWIPTFLNRPQIVSKAHGLAPLFVQTPGVTLHLESHGQSLPIRYGDKLLLFDKNSELLFERTLYTGDSLEIIQEGNINLLEILPRATTALIARIEAPQSK